MPIIDQPLLETRGLPQTGGLFRGGGRMINRRFVPPVVGGGYDPDAQAYFNAIVSNGGTISTTSKGYVNTFVLAAKSNGYWSKMNRINPFCGDQLSACLVPLKIGGGATIDINNNFINGDYSESNGLVGDGASKYLDTSLIPSVSMTVNDTTLGYYMKAGTYGEMGSKSFVTVLGGPFDLIVGQFGAGWVTSEQYDTNNGNGAIFVNGTLQPPAYYMGSRVSTSSHTAYANGGIIGNNAGNGGNFSEASISIFALNSNFGVTQYSDGTLGGYVIGAGFSDTDALNFYTNFKALNDSLGR